MQMVAAAGLLVLVPCAVVLNYRAMSALEIAELAAGGLNLALLALNFRDGRALTRRRRAARRRAAGREPARRTRAAARQVVDTKA
jgi:hypothetical protein